DDQRLNNKTAALSAGEWADSLTNISVGDLLAEVPHDLDDNCADHPVAISSQCLQQIPFSCDSFDAANLDIKTRWKFHHQHPMHLPSGMLKKHVMPSHSERILFLVYQALLPQRQAK
ncbi:hypothetical protein CCACVL1_30534, partial [Corchorus capsularis]